MKSKENILCETIIPLSQYLTLTDMFRLSEVNLELSQTTEKDGFRGVLMTQMNINRWSVSGVKDISIKGLLRIFSPSQVVCAVCIGDLKMNKACHVTLQWEGCLFKAKQLTYFRFQNSTYTSLFFPWDYIKSWHTESIEKDTTLITFNLIDNVRVQNIYHVDNIRLQVKQHNVEVLMANILNRCNMLKCLVEGVLGLKYDLMQQQC